MTHKRNLNDEGEARASRRHFTKTLAAAVVAAPAAGAIARAQTPPANKQEPKAPPNPQPTPTPAPQGPPKPSPLAEAYAEAARLRFGEHLSAEQLESVKRDLEGNVRTAERLRGFKLQNSDEPDFVFSA
ncbi:MAG TPA: hypothetical protein VNZ44_01265 [Pyrinomonadaceae bacterium]|nr:hypothetical protein [Pyrinomonadaceae bacterium]